MIEKYNINKMKHKNNFIHRLENILYSYSYKKIYFIDIVKDKYPKSRKK